MKQPLYTNFSLFKFSSLIFLLFCTILGYAQPANNTCVNATPITNVQNFCSGVGQYTLLGATDDGDGTCEIGNRDVWFSFVAQFTDVTITIVGAIVGPTAGGTLNDPELVIYSGTCTSLSEIKCDADLVGDNVIEGYKGGLTPGATYYFKVDSRTTIGATFQVCINNYNAPQFPDGDCPTATVLCDKSSFNVQSVIGAGSDNQEMQDAFCFHTGTVPTQTLETNSVWYTWRALTTGTVSFDLTPTNPADDLDFVVYNIPNGFNPNGGINCTGKTVERCMASGNLPAWTTCFGPTGLDLISQQHYEKLNCNNDSPISPTNPALAIDDNYAKAVDQLQGQVYALVINNFSSTGNGFSISFGGTGLFEGPINDFSIDTSGVTACVLDQVTVTDLSSYPIGQIVSWEWNFGLDATPANAFTQGPHTVSYSSFGPKIITLTITSDRGCKVTKQKTVNVDNCIPDLTPRITILPNVANGISALGVVVEVSEINNAKTDGSPVEVWVPIDPRLTFAWDPALTAVAGIPVNNADWLYVGNNGFVHIFSYSGLTGSIPALGKTTLGVQATYDPEFTSGFTTVNATVYPYSGGEINVSNNTSSEQLTYFN